MFLLGYLLLSQEAEEFARGYDNIKAWYNSSLRPHFEALADAMSRVDHDTFDKSADSLSFALNQDKFVAAVTGKLREQMLTLEKNGRPVVPKVQVSAADAIGAQLQ